MSGASSASSGSASYTSSCTSSRSSRSGACSSATRGEQLDEEPQLNAREQQLRFERQREGLLRIMRDERAQEPVRPLPHERRPVVDNAREQREQLQREIDEQFEQRMREQHRTREEQWLPREESRLNERGQQLRFERQRERLQRLWLVSRSSGRRTRRSWAVSPRAEPGCTFQR